MRALSSKIDHPYTVWSQVCSIRQMTSLESWKFSQDFHFLSRGFDFGDLFRKTLTDIDKKNGRKMDFLSCWLLLLHKGLCRCGKICVQDTHWHAAKATIFRWMKRFSGGQSDSQDNRGEMWKNKKMFWRIRSSSCEDNGTCRCWSESSRDWVSWLSLYWLVISIRNPQREAWLLEGVARWFWCLKTRGIGYNIQTQKLCLKLTETVIQSAFMKL